MPGQSNPKLQGSPQKRDPPTDKRSDSPSPGRGGDDAGQGGERSTQKPGHGMSSGQRKSDQTGDQSPNDEDVRGMDRKEND